MNYLQGYQTSKMDAFDILLVRSSKTMPSLKKHLQNYASNVIHFLELPVYIYNL
jgi:hypothetical protein